MRNKKSKTLKTISFDEEVVSKDAAEEILSKNEENKREGTQKVKKKKRPKSQLQQDINANGPSNNVEKKRKSPETHEEHDISPPKIKKKKKHIDSTISEDNAEMPTLSENDTKMKKRKKKSLVEKHSEENSEINEDNNEATTKKKKESIRERKRKQHLRLLDEKKMKSEIQMQQKSLNYLSKWKHSREEWKFEKLRQIWLQHNMYDSTKIPDEFWGILIEYFGNAKGKIRDVVLKEAIKLIEETSEDDENEVKVQRARDIVQNLQE